MANLEVVLADEGNSTGKLFTFRGPTAYTQILTGSSVEGVTIANNHARDYGQAGYDSTKQVLEAAGVEYVEAYTSNMFTLENGLVVGLYAIDGSVAGIEKDRAVEGVKQLKEDGAELIIVAAHWGTEGKYRLNLYFLLAQGPKVGQRSEIGDLPSLYCSWMQVYTCTWPCRHPEKCQSSSEPPVYFSFPITSFG